MEELPEEPMEVQSLAESGASNVGKKGGDGSQDGQPAGFQQAGSQPAPAPVEPADIARLRAAALEGPIKDAADVKAINSLTEKNSYMRFLRRFSTRKMKGLAPALLERFQNKETRAFLFVDFVHTGGDLERMKLLQTKRRLQSQRSNLTFRPLSKKDTLAPLPTSAFLASPSFLLGPSLLPSSRHPFTFT
jgi:hypothetical protein